MQRKEVLIERKNGFDFDVEYWFCNLIPIQTNEFLKGVRKDEKRFYTY